MNSENGEKADRYLSFMNIDCYKHASDVIDCILEVTKDERYNNRFWEAFTAKIPQCYYEHKSDEKVLYHICSSVFYIEELFEESAHSLGLELMTTCEYQCC
ncbi:MAG: N(2)-fixation sustaining protein CowN [Sulfuricurvum sp.]|uniref:N(2)-fixation sustaining protein CowN n=1 Tax=Sulfuricurvum sp. TaxID=2025608 RepID=UPI00260C08A6|nr:N(2)-fixation sustaining protein CowN [Sulfuricurvum sp.]MDD5159850.1 N(2)-fixation sustaining protein CowN [Sulfuricurvum sp.]